MKKILVATIISVLQISKLSIAGDSSEWNGNLMHNFSNNEFPEKFEDLRNKTGDVMEAVRTIGRARRIEKDEKPGIVISGSKLYFNKKLLEFGVVLDKWTGILPGQPRCIKERRTVCIWENIGLLVGSDDKTPPHVEFLNIHLSIPEFNAIDALIVAPMNRNSESPEADWQVHHPFKGYLEIDGFEINSKTKFWKILAGVDKGRNLRCGLRNCEFPHGEFSKNQGLYFRLNGNDENGTVKQLSISP